MGREWLSQCLGTGVADGHGLLPPVGPRHMTHSMQPGLTHAEVVRVDPASHPLCAYAIAAGGKSTSRVRARRQALPGRLGQAVGVHWQLSTSWKCKAHPSRSWAAARLTFQRERWRPQCGLMSTPWRWHPSFRSTSCKAGNQLAGSNGASLRSATRSPTARQGALHSHRQVPRALAVRPAASCAHGMARELAAVTRSTALLRRGRLPQ